MGCHTELHGAPELSGGRWGWDSSQGSSSSSQWPTGIGFGVGLTTLPRLGLKWDAAQQ